MRRALAGPMIVVLALAAGCGDDDGGGGSAGAFCDQVEAFIAENGALFGEESSFDFTDTDALSELVSDLNDMDPPGEIADDWNTVVEALEFYVEAFADVDFNDPEALAELEELSAEIEERTGDFEAAGDRVNTFITDDCGIDIDE